MITRMVRSKMELDQLLRFLGQRDIPYTVNIIDGESRSLAQNRLQHQWMLDLSSQGDQSPSDYRKECKLWFGVPLLRAEDERFREQYDRTIKGLPYATKIDLMDEPIDFPVTRLMTKRQMTRYLDAIWQHYTGNGFVLTDPSVMGLDDLGERHEPATPPAH